MHLPARTRKVAPSALFGFPNLIFVPNCWVLNAKQMQTQLTAARKRRQTPPTTFSAQGWGLCAVTCVTIHFFSWRQRLKRPVATEKQAVDGSKQGFLRNGKSLISSQPTSKDKLMFWFLWSDTRCTSQWNNNKLTPKPTEKGKCSKWIMNIELRCVHHSWRHRMINKLNRAHLCLLFGVAWPFKVRSRI